MCHLWALHVVIKWQFFTFIFAVLFSTEFILHMYIIAQTGLRFCENKRPPYWNSTFGFNFDLSVVICISFCISIPNVVWIGRSAVTLCRFSRVTCWTRTVDVAKLNVDFWGSYPLRSPIIEKSGMRKWTYMVCCSMPFGLIGALCRCWWARNPKFHRIFKFNIVW